MADMHRHKRFNFSFHNESVIKAHSIKLYTQIINQFYGFGFHLKAFFCFAFHYFHAWKKTFMSFSASSRITQSCSVRWMSIKGIKLLLSMPWRCLYIIAVMLCADERLSMMTYWETRKRIFSQSQTTGIWSSQQLRNSISSINWLESYWCLVASIAARWCCLTNTKFWIADTTNKSFLVKLHFY